MIDEAEIGELGGRGEASKGRVGVCAGDESLACSCKARQKKKGLRRKRGTSTTLQSNIVELEIQLSGSNSHINGWLVCARVMDLLYA